MASLGRGYNVYISYSKSATGDNNKATIYVTATVKSEGGYSWSSDNWPDTLTAQIDGVGSSSKNIYSQDAGSSISQSYSYEVGPGTYTVRASYSIGRSSSGYKPTTGNAETGIITVPAATAVVDVNPKINGTMYNSGKDGFTFNMSGKVTQNNVIDYYNGTASPGTYTATPNAKVGYNTTAASSFVAAGGTITLVPTWTSKTTAVTLNSDGASSHGTTSVTASYDLAMPTITPPSRNGADFLGYYSSPNGQGTQYYKADGTSNRAWNIVSDSLTLYAYWNFHDFLYVSKDGSSYELAHIYVSKDGGPYTLLDGSMVKISKDGSNFTQIV